jgi:MarR family transcriptional regulator, organic hydroperoxide resistance regulator
MSDVDDKKQNVDFGNPANDKFRLDNYPFYLVSQIDQRYGLEMEKVLGKHKMERVQWQILLILREKNPSSISELSERSGKKLSTVSRVIERMRNEDLVSTAPRKIDNRITDVFLNEAGRQALDKVLKVASKQYEHAINSFSKEEIKQLGEQLQRILVNLNRSPFE